MDENDSKEPRQDVRTAGSDAIKWSAIVVIVLAVLYFLAQYVIPLFR